MRFDGSMIAESVYDSHQIGFKNSVVIILNEQWWVHIIAQLIAISNIYQTFGWIYQGFK